MPIAALARFFAPHTSALADVPVDADDVSVLALRLEQAKLVGHVSLETIRLITLEHRVQAAKKAKVAAKKAQAEAAAAHAQSAARKQEAAASKKRARRQLRAARGHRAVVAARLSKGEATDNLEAADRQLKQTAHTLSRAKAAHRAASQVNALAQPSCLGGRLGAASTRGLD